MVQVALFSIQPWIGTVHSSENSSYLACGTSGAIKHAGKGRNSRLASCGLPGVSKKPWGQILEMTKQGVSSEGGNKLLPSTLLIRDKDLGVWDETGNGFDVMRKVLIPHKLLSCQSLVAGIHDNRKKPPLWCFITYLAFFTMI